MNNRLHTPTGPPKVLRPCPFCNKEFGARDIRVHMPQRTPQSAKVETAFATALQATVLDAEGNGVPNVLVTFTLPSSGASGTFAQGVNTATTNANGQATASVFTANDIPGSYVVTAGFSGVATPANFSLTNTAATLQSIAVTPAHPSIVKGTTQQFTATGTYSDSSTQNLTSQVTWALDLRYSCLLRRSKADASPKDPY